MTKYKNIKTNFSGLVFDSKKEAMRWGELLILERIGEIESLDRQVSITLMPGVKLKCAHRARPAIRLVIDFKYQRDGKTIHEDVKSAATRGLPVFLLKAHLAKVLHDIDIEVV